MKCFCWIYCRRNNINTENIFYSNIIFSFYLSVYSSSQDYHVFFMHNPSPNRCLVFDLDTTLPFPTYFHKYVTETFRSDYAVSEDHHRWVFILLCACRQSVELSGVRRKLKISFYALSMSSAPLHKFNNNKSMIL
jgi:hypothetical protein